MMDCSELARRLNAGSIDENNAIAHMLFIAYNAK